MPSLSRIGCTATVGFCCVVVGVDKDCVLPTLLLRLWVPETGIGGALGDVGTSSLCNVRSSAPGVARGWDSFSKKWTNACERLSRL